VSEVGTASPSIQLAFAQVIGKSENTMSQCATAAGVVAGELLQAIGKSDMRGKEE
jgi:hypothetical protein